MSNPLKQLAGQTAIYGASTIIGRLLNYFLTPLYTRLFLKGEYGIFSEFQAYIPFFLILLTYGMETGFFRFAKDKENSDKTFSTILTSLLVTGTLFIVLIIAFIDPIANLIDYPNHHEYIYLCAFIVALDAFISVPFARLRLLNKAVKFAAIKLTNIGITIALNLFFLLLCPYLAEKNFPFIEYIYNKDLGITYIFISFLISNIITVLLLLPDILKVKFNFDIKLLKKIFVYSIPLLIAGFAGMFNEVVDRIFIKNLLSNVSGLQYAQEQVGIYSANYKMAMLMAIFIQMFRYAAEPFFFQNKNENNAREIYAKVTKYFIIFGLTIFLFVVYYMDIFKYFIGEEFREGLRIVPILLIANLFLGIFFNLSMWYKLNDKTKYGAIITIIGAIITVVLNYTLIPYFGYVASAWATLICYVVMCVLSYLWGQKYYKIPYDIKNIFFYFVIASILYLINYFVIEKFIENIIIILVLNTILLVVFIIIAIKKEKAMPIIKAFYKSFMAKIGRK